MQRIYYIALVLIDILPTRGSAIAEETRISGALHWRLSK